MPFKMECRKVVWWRYHNSSAEVRKAFDRAVDDIFRDWMRGSPALNHGSLNVRRYRFRHGVLTYRYQYDASDLSTHIEIIAWKKAEEI